MTIGIILSTGRCGTVSVAEYLTGFRLPGVQVFHERFEVHETQPGRFFRAYQPDRQRELAALPAVRRLLDELDQLPPGASYIETGWTLYPVIPLLIDRYPERVRVLHLVRHPIYSAASLALHGLYEEATTTHYRIPESDIVPSSPGVAHTELHPRWKELSPFERNLFRVGEITRFGLELPGRYPGLRTQRLRTEDFSPAAGADILQFFGLPVPSPAPPLPRANSTRRIARGARGIGREWREASRWPWLQELCAELGYDCAPDSLQEGMQRYVRSGWFERLAGLAYKVPPLRFAYRRLGVPLVRKRGRSGHT